MGRHENQARRVGKPTDEPGEGETVDTPHADVEKDSVEPLTCTDHADHVHECGGAVRCRRHVLDSLVLPQEIGELGQGGDFIIDSQ